MGVRFQLFDQLPGSQELDFKLFLDGLKMPCFEGVVSVGGACSRFYDT